MAICRQACPYNTLDGCKVKAYGGVCPLTNTAQPFTEYKMTNADRIRAMNAEQLAEWALFRAPQIGREYSHSLIGLITWLQQPAEENDYD